MVAKKTMKKPAKLSVKKSTVKDLDVKADKAGGVKGGAATSGSGANCLRSKGCP